MYRLLGTLTVCLFFASGCETKQNILTQKDVTFFGTGKVSRYQQINDGSLQQLEPLFFAEIFITDGGTVKNASVQLPQISGEIKSLEYRYSESDEIGDVMYISAMLDSYESLEDEFPMGDYSFSFETSEGKVKDSIVSYKNSSFPPHPKIIFIQNEKKIEINEVNSEKELIITWPEFSVGKQDPKKILDDPIFVAIDSCNMEDIVNSGRPFEKNGYLTYEASEYYVPAGKLEPGQKYDMYVEHAIFTDTQDDNGIPGFATLASSTYMSFKTMGNHDPNYCRED